MPQKKGIFFPVQIYFLSDVYSISSPVLCYPYSMSKKQNVGIIYLYNKYLLITSTCLVIETLVFEVGNVLKDHLIQVIHSTEGDKRGKMTYQGHTAF